MAGSEASGARPPRPELERLLGPDGVLDGLAERTACAHDLLDGVALPELVLRPTRSAQVAPALAVLAKAGIACAPRGAGLSYSRGALPAVPRWVAFDLRGLDRVLEINALDGYVTVEAGCTWRALDAALAAHDLRTPFWGPASGYAATVGSTLAQDAVFFGSGQHGTAGGSVLSLAVACADGAVLRTGSASIATGGSPFLRGFGPDLTGLFIGDCGALGIKIEATLRVRPRPRALGSSAFGFADLGHAAAVLAALGAEQLASECLLVGSASTGPRDALIDFVVESRSTAEAGLRHARADEICAAHGGTRLGDGAMRGWRDTPFADMSSLSAEPGVRWAPVHGLVPHSRLLEAVTALEALLRPAGSELARIGFAWHWVAMLIGPGAVLIEPSLYWREAAETANAAGLAGQADPAVLALRAALAGALARVGSVHLQIGRFYPFAARLQPPALGLLRAVKTQLDPAAILNPGVLGLGE